MTLMNEPYFRFLVGEGSEKGETILEAGQFVPRSIEEIFEFFSVETNLEKITPDFMGFHVLGKSTPTIGEGTLIDYRLSVHGIPMRWRTLIESWKPGESFVDTQLKGPYALWHHTHRFEARDGGTWMTDRVRYRLPLGALGKLVAGAFVKKDVRTIFQYRVAAVKRLLG